MSLPYPVGVSLGSAVPLRTAGDSGLSQFQRMKAIGFTTVRIDAFYVSSGAISNDGMVRAARNAGLNVLLILDGYDITIGVTAFTTFVASTVSTYSPLGVHTYEILNEENYYINWDTSSNETVSPSGYATLLTNAYGAVKGIDSSATVLLGGLANTSESDGTSLGSGNYYQHLTQQTFIADVYSALGGSSTGAFDAVAVHPYTFPLFPTGSGDNFGNALAPTGTTVRTIMVANGDTAKKIWITEFGAPSGSDDGETNYVTQAAQRDCFRVAFNILAGWSASYVGEFFCFNWMDDADGDFGLTDSTYNPKMALGEVVASININNVVGFIANGSGLGQL